MKFPYQSSFIIGAAPPSFAPGSTLRWRPFAPVNILHPVTKIRRQFNRALMDTGADQTVFPERLLTTLGLTPIPAPGQAMVWRGVSYPMKFAEAQLVLTDGVEEYRWNAVVGFSSAPIPYIVLGQAGCLDFFNVHFFGYDRYTEIEKNAAFPGPPP
jgi:hypothetical protein